MGKKIIISDIIVKISMDTANAVKQLKSYEDRLAKAKKRAEAAEKRGGKSAKQKVKDAKAFLAGSREFHKLRKRSNQDALKAERALKKAYLANDKVQINSIKRQIGERLNEYKVQDKLQSDLHSKRLKANKILQQKQDRARVVAQRKAIQDARLKDKADKDAQIRALRARRIIQQKEDKAHKAAAQGRREQEMHDRRRIRHEAHLARLKSNQRIKALKYVAQSSGTPFSGAGNLAMGGGAAAVSAGVISTQNLIEYRRAENAARTAVQQSGSKSNAQDIINISQKNSDYFGVNRAEGLQNFTKLRNAVKVDKLSDEDILFANQAFSASALATGSTKEQLQRSMEGMVQMITGGVQGDELNQVLQNMTALGPVFFKAMSNITGKKIESKADINKMDKAEKANISGAELIKEVAKLANDPSIEAYKKSLGTLPTETQLASQRLNTASMAFAEGFEKPLIKIMMRVTNFMETHHEEIKKAGETFGEVVLKMMDVIEILYKKAEPYLKQLTEFIQKTPAEELANIITQIIEIVFWLKALSVVAELAIGFKKLYEVFALFGGLFEKLGMVKALKYLQGGPAGVVAAIGAYNLSTSWDEFNNSVNPDGTMKDPATMLRNQLFGGGNTSASNDTTNSNNTVTITVQGDVTPGFATDMYKKAAELVIPNTSPM